MKASIKPNERIAVVGMTGSGKTYLVTQLAQAVRRLVVFDPKGTLGAGSGFNLEQWDNPDDSAIVGLLEHDEPARLRVMAPITDNPADTYEQFFEKIYHAGNVIVYIDEAYGVTYGTKAGKWLTALYTRGRELGIGIWASSQRPSWIPLFMLSETDWRFCFRLQLDVDRRRMAEIMGAQVLRPITDKHGFWYGSNDMGQPAYVKQLKG